MLKTPMPNYTGQEIIAHFQHIATRYDLLNHLFSLGRDIAWRKIVLRFLEKGSPAEILDACTGTGDMALLLTTLPSTLRITGVDLAENMLTKAREKTAKAVGTATVPTIHYMRGDVTRLPFPGECFDAVTICFGLRNIEDRDQALSELMRVLKPNGRLCVLEFAPPHRTHMLAPFYRLHLNIIIPVVGSIVAGSLPAYRHLATSIQSFPQPRHLIAMLKTNGGTRTKAVPLTFGIVYLYCCTKKLQ